MFYNIFLFLMMLESRVPGQVRVHLSKPDANTMQIDFVWPAFKFSKKLDVLEIVTTYLTQEEYVDLLVKEAYKEYHQEDVKKIKKFLDKPKG